MSSSLNPYAAWSRPPKRSKSLSSRWTQYVPADVEEQPSWPYQPLDATFPRGGYARAYDDAGYANARMWYRGYQEPQPQPEPQGYHPLLSTSELNSGVPPMRFDVRFMEAYDHYNRPLHDALHSPKAFEKPLKRVRLVSKSIPWSIQVRNDKGITLRDIIFAVYTELQQPLTESEYWLATDDDRERMVKAYTAAQQTRIARLPRNKDEGVKRVDYLGTRTEFAGIRAVKGNAKDEVYAEKRLAGFEKNLDAVFLLKFREAQVD